MMMIETNKGWRKYDGKMTILGLVESTAVKGTVWNSRLMAIKTNKCWQINDGNNHPGACMDQKFADDGSLALQTFGTLQYKLKNLILMPRRFTGDGGCQCSLYPGGKQGSKKQSQRDMKLCIKVADEQEECQKNATSCHLFTKRDFSSTIF